MPHIRCACKSPSAWSKCKLTCSARIVREKRASFVARGSHPRSNDMADKHSVASPPDDAEHRGSMTLPEQTMVEVDDGKAPELSRDPARVMDRDGRIGILPITIGVSIIVLFLVLILFMP